MPSDLDKTFLELESFLADRGALNASKSDPFFYFVFPPEEAIEVKGRLVAWTARLRNAGLEVGRLSLSDIVWDIVDAADSWDEWLENEAEFDQSQVNEAVTSLLRGGNALIARVAERISAMPSGSVLLLTEAEMLHPYYRVRALESALHDRVKVPTVVFYPGHRSGQYGLRFLDFYPEDANYRATVLGGLT